MVHAIEEFYNQDKRKLTPDHFCFVFDQFYTNLWDITSTQTIKLPINILLQL